jgi:hypothetical protein
VVKEYQKAVRRERGVLRSWGCDSISLAFEEPKGKRKRKKGKRKENRPLPLKSLVGVFVCVVRGAWCVVRVFSRTRMKRARMCESDAVEKMAFFVEKRKEEERRGKAGGKEITSGWLGGGQRDMWEVEHRLVTRVVSLLFR